MARIARSCEQSSLSRFTGHPSKAQPGVLPARWEPLRLAAFLGPALILANSTTSLRRHRSNITTRFVGLSLFPIFYSYRQECHSGVVCTDDGSPQSYSCRSKARHHLPTQTTERGSICSLDVPDTVISYSAGRLCLVLAYIESYLSRRWSDRLSEVSCFSCMHAAPLLASCMMSCHASPTPSPQTRA
jgi:hypothetical protein